MVEIKKKQIISSLFDSWQETLIYSCLQDYMGKAYADAEVNPQSAQIVIGDFCFLAGKPDQRLAEHKPDERSSDFIIMIPQHEGWSSVIEAVYGDRAVRRSRYAIKKEPEIFDREKLQAIAEGLPDSYELKMIDREIYTQTAELEWARDLCSQFQTYEDYKKRGLGTAICKNGVLVSGASSYTVYQGGIEIEIDTREDERRKGLALVCGARLILACLDRGLYPSWDAQNMGSVALAEKLGYHFDHEYPAYEICGYGMTSVKQAATGSIWSL